MAEPVTERILIPAGQRNGRTFDNEGDFLAALADGKEVFTTRNQVFFSVTKDGEGVRYTALAERPEGI